MEYKDLYNTYTIIEEIESGVLPVQESLSLKIRQWLFAMVDEVEGRWKGGNPFDDLERLSDIMKENIDHASQSLEEPERTLVIRENAMIWAQVTKIRKELEVRFREEERE
jgi:hypothetical protein